MLNSAFNLHKFKPSALTLFLLTLSFWNILQAVQNHKDCQKGCGAIIEYNLNWLSDPPEINPEFMWHTPLPDGSIDMTWTPIQLFEENRSPKKLPGTVHDIPFPKVPAKWYGNKTTGISFKSALIQKISGVSFKGRITPWNTVDKVPGNQNAFTIFYHQVSDYRGGSEYGIVFRVDEKNIIFYTLMNANLHNQQWEQWPTQLASIDIVGDVAQAMQLASKTHEWSITVTPAGNFIFSITDPKTGSISSSEILKPSDFPNLYQTDGYITMSAQKFMNVTLNHNPHLKIQEVEVLHP